MQNTITFAKVNTDGEALRIRRSHIKSRTGCDPCKKRRIKCDEQVPKCGACKRKKVGCTISQNTSNEHIKATEPAENVVSPMQKDIAILQMRLLYSFEKHTADTLVLNSVWPKVIPIAFEVCYSIQSYVVD
jgi:Fungal Zn(2)-Cys(6) binuclear cluster domain